VGRRYNRAFSGKEAVKHHALEEIEQTGEKACESVREESHERACGEKGCAEVEPRQGFGEAGKACCETRRQEAKASCQACGKTAGGKNAPGPNIARARCCSIRIQDPAAAGEAFA
jgi:hypothetical protein